MTQHSHTIFSFFFPDNFSARCSEFTPNSHTARIEYNLYVNLPRFEKIQSTKPISNGHLSFETDTLIWGASFPSFFPASNGGGRAWAGPSRLGLQLKCQRSRFEQDRRNGPHCGLGEASRPILQVRKRNTTRKPILFAACFFL